VTGAKKKQEIRGRDTSPTEGELGWPAMARRPKPPTVMARARVRGGVGARLRSKGVWQGLWLCLNRARRGGEGSNARRAMAINGHGFDFQSRGGRLKRGN
jgi:hypothetical protein